MSDIKLISAEETTELLASYRALDMYEEELKRQLNNCRERKKAIGARMLLANHPEPILDAHPVTSPTTQNNGTNQPNHITRPV